MEAKDFSALRISLASPETIKSWSYGEVTKPETINYRRLRPEKDGLFCEVIFGPTRDWQCYCGKYKNIRYKGVVCDKCGVEVTKASVRRERMGHITLAAPVAHVWYTRRVPSYLGLLLDISRRNLDRVLYFAQYVITSVDENMRQRALARIDKELEIKERELGGDIESRIRELKGQHDQVVTEYEERVHQINQHFDSEFERISAELEKEAADVIARLQALMGQTAVSDIGSKDLDVILVAKGELVTQETIERFNELVATRMASLQEEIDRMRRDEINALSNQMQGMNAKTNQSVDEHLKELEERLAAIRASAQKQKDELNELAVLQFLPDNRYNELKKRYGSVFQADMGAEAFYKILKNLDLDKMSAELWREVRNTRSKQRKKKATKRLRVVESLRKSNNRPEWMILTVLPVIPPDLRPMVQLDGGRFATSDLNDLYRRVINRNNRLKHLLELGAPDVIVRNEKRMLQEAVDSLIDNSQRGKALSRRGRRELKSLSDMLKGKKGRFRRNLLGKRVDYSGRSVIVVGPRLKLSQCGLPKSMALELYRPFVISKLVEKNYANNVKGAKRSIEREKPEVWEILEEVIKERPVLLNRAPTLHRLGIQAFEPILVEGKAIQIHPLVCSAFNADFDGDQMAVHVPLSRRAVEEARTRMLSTKNLLKPSDGQPIVGPAKDMLLGIYYLTLDPSIEIITLREHAGRFRRMADLRESGARIGIEFRSNGYYYVRHRDFDNIVLFKDNEELHGSKLVVKERAQDLAMQALLNGEVDVLLDNYHRVSDYLRKHKLEDRVVVTNLHERRAVVNLDEVEYLYGLKLVDLHTPILLGNVYDNRAPQGAPIPTTVGRAIFNRILPDELRFVQQTLDKKGLAKLVARCYQVLGSDRTTDIVDAIKDYGFRFATVSGTTIAVSDLTVPEERAAIMEEAEATVAAMERSYRRGSSTEEERYQHTVDTWTAAKEKLEALLQKTLDPFGPVAVMALSGSTKGGFGPITQLAGMRGLMADPSGRIIDLPIRSHFREGLNAMEYFISTHGTRKGLADTALRTADAGYLTRRLVDVAQDVIVNRMDCGVEHGLVLKRSDDVAGQTLYERIVGRCSTRPIFNPNTGELIIDRNGLINEEIAEIIQNIPQITEVEVRSPMTCALVHGVCALCYGRDLGTGEMVEIGTAVGIIAAQSIGEPGTQLTLRTFHTGGTAASGGDITSGLPRVEELFEARRKPKGESVMIDEGGVLRLTIREDGIRQARVINTQLFRQEHRIPQNYELTVVDGQTVRKGELIARQTDGDGQVLADLQGDIYIEHDVTTEDGFKGTVVYIRYEERKEDVYDIPANARLMPGIVDGMEVKAGTQLTEGSLNPHQILRVLGEEATQLYLLTEIQKVYRQQGVSIADKHFEVMIRKMLSKVQITKSGDSELLPGDLIDKLELLSLNEELIAAGKEPAAGIPVLLGITKAALSTDSFLSASSFQHTIKVLAGAAIEGKKDPLYGLKENVIIGKLIPAGTGFSAYQERERVGPRTTLQAQGAYDFESINSDEEEENEEME